MRQPKPPSKEILRMMLERLTDEELDQLIKERVLLHSDGGSALYAGNGMVCNSHGALEDVRLGLVSRFEVILDLDDEPLDDEPLDDEPLM